MTLAEFCNVVRFKVNNDDVDKVNSTINNIKSMAQNLLGAIGIGISLTAMNAIVEEFGRVNDQIKNSTSQLGDQHDVQQKILESATATRSEYAQTARVISDLVHENAELFGSIDEAAKFNNAATMLFKSAGKTNEEIAGLMEAINKSFAKGYIDSETLSQLLERSPEAIELINKKLGTTSDQLENLASDGIFTVTHLKEAFTDNADEIERKFSNVKLRITDALTIIRNRWGFWLTDLNETTNLTDQVSRVMISGFDKLMGFLTRVGKGISFVVDKLGGMGNMLKLIAMVAASLFIAFKLDDMLKGLRGIFAVIKGIDPALLGMAAKFLILFLIIDDIINFLKGNDSLIGSLLEQAGIDVDEFRELIFTTWDNIKGYLAPFLDAITQLASGAGEFILGIIAGVFNIIIGLLKAFNALFSGDWEGFWNAIAEIFLAVVETIVNLFETAFTTILEIGYSIYEGVSGIVSDIADVIMSGLQVAIDWIVGLADDAVTWGADIIQGICDGIMSGIDWIADAAGSIAQEIKDWIGFSEPEKGPLSNFHTYMPDMVDLMTKGIRDGRAKVQAAVGEVAAALAILANANTVTPRSAYTAIGGSTTKNVTQNVEINNKFEGDVAAQRHAAGAMKKSAKDTTYEMAKALSMT